MKSALLVVDVQRDVVANAYRRDAVIGNISELVNRARNLNVLIIWVQHSDDELIEGSDGWAYVPELRFEQGEPVIINGMAIPLKEPILRCCCVLKALNG